MKNMNRSKLFVLVASVWALLSWLGMNSCARIGSPSGGPRDTIPPVLLRSEPAFGATAFKGKRIRLYFDEFPAVKDQEKELLISPPLQKRVGMTVKGKSVLLDIRDDSLFRNTTYRLMFGKSIVDNNESNPLTDLYFVFSTGAGLDSLKLTGAVYDAQTAMPLIGVTAMAYEQTSDSLVLSGRPDKIAKTDSAGVFTLHNLKATPYRVVVVEDVNGNYRYDIGSEKIGFTTGLCMPVGIGHDHHDMDLISAFKEPNTKQFLLSVERKERRAIRMIFNAPNPRIDSLQLWPLETFDYTLQVGTQGDTLTYWLSNPAQSIPDSLVLRMRYFRTDTADRLVQMPYRTELLFKDTQAKETKKERRLGAFSGLLKGEPDSVALKNKTDSLTRAAHYALAPKWIGGALLLPPVGLGMQFPAPLVSMDTSRMRVTKQVIRARTKDTVITPVPFRLMGDPNKWTDYRVSVNWEPGAWYVLEADSGMFRDIYGRTNPVITQKWLIPDPEKMSSITLKVEGMQDSSGYVVELLAENGSLVRRQIVHSNPLVFTFLSAGKYKLRVLEDVNRNGKQDLGSFALKKQPERVANVGGIGKEALIHLREGWEIEQTIKLDELFR